eukprot:8778446-Pyramimonas_sp.AAC.1
MPDHVPTLCLLRNAIITAACSAARINYHSADCIKSMMLPTVEANPSSEKATRSASSVRV